MPTLQLLLRVWETLVSNNRICFIVIYFFFVLLKKVQKSSTIREFT